MMRACVRIHAGDRSEMLAKILRSEAGDDISRTEVRVESDGGVLSMDIAAADVVAMRAALNSYLRWAKLAIDADEALGGIE